MRLVIIVVPTHRRGPAHHVATGRLELNGPFHQFHWLHGRMQIVLLRFLDLPDVALVAVAAPVTLGALGPAIEDRFVLALVVARPRVTCSLAQMMNVDQWPPAARNAACGRSSSLDDIAT